MQNILNLLNIADNNRNKSVSKSQFPQKIVRFNRYILMNNVINSPTRLNVMGIVNVYNDDRLDKIQFTLNDIDYYWVFYRLNWHKIDFLSIPIQSYIIEYDYDKITQSVIRK